MVNRMGTDMFTTHEVWFTGQRMLATETWPRFLKPAFKSLSNPDTVGAVLARHPDFGRIDGGNWNQRLSMGGVRTALWERR